LIGWACVECGLSSFTLGKNASGDPDNWRDRARRIAAQNWTLPEIFDDTMLRCASASATEALFAALAELGTIRQERKMTRRRSHFMFVTTCAMAVGAALLVTGTPAEAVQLGSCEENRECKTATWDDCRFSSGKGCVWSAGWPFCSTNPSGCPDT
jgi:hypothetical protein